MPTYRSNPDNDGDITWGSTYGYKDIPVEHTAEGTAGVAFGGNDDTEKAEAIRQQKEDADAAAKKQQEDIIKAMEQNMNGWGDAMTKTMKEIMGGKGE